jgi:hypothetical protein
MKCLAFVATFSSILCAGHAALGQPRARAPLPRPPPLIAGFGVGPAFPDCDDCDLSAGIGARGFLVLPIVLPFGIGITAEHENFRLGSFGKAGYTFTGIELILSTGFGLTWQLEVLFAFGGGQSDAATSSGYDSAVAGELGFRLGRRIGPRTRLGVSVSASGMATRYESNTSNGSTAPPPATDFVTGAKLLTMDIAFDLGPTPPSHASAD